MKAEPPEPGTPEGCEGFMRHGQWFGWSKERAVTVHRVRVWLSQGHRDRGGKAMELLIASNRILSTQRASKGVPGKLLKMIREQQDQGKTSREVCDVIRGAGGVVEPPPLDEQGKHATEEYKTKSGKPPMWRNVWQASQHLATLIHDKAAGGPGHLERAGIETTLRAQLFGIGGPTSRNRRAWIESLSSLQLSDLAWAVRAAGNAIVQDPPHWQWWTGKTGSRHFLQVNEYSCTVGVRPIISYKAGPSCLRSLLLRWVGPNTDFVKQSGIERQRQLFQETA